MSEVTTTITQAFVAMRQQSDERRADIESQIAALDAEVEEANQTIRRLEERQRAARAEQEQHRREIEELARERQVTELRTALEALKASQVDLQATETYWTALQNLREQRQALFDQDPSLEDVWRDYCDFEANPDAVLNALPATYRPDVQQAHERKRQRLTPLLALNEQAAALARPIRLRLVIVVAHDAAIDQFFWALPVPASAGESSAIPLVYEQSANAILAALSGFLDHKEWYIADRASEVWGGYFVWSMLAQYSGDRSLDELTRERVCEGLRQIPPFDSMELSLDVVQLAWDVWLQGRNAPANQQPAEVAQQPAPEPASEPDLSQSLYTLQDLTAWDRPLKVVTGSAWNVQARRMRTLLLRLVARGEVGGEGIPIGMLHQGLPEKHAKAMQEAIQQMIGSNLLQQTLPDAMGRTRVTVNTGLLDEVGSLINQNVTPFWSELFDSEVSF